MKAAEFRELGVEELNQRAKELRRELVLARISKSNQQLKNPLKIRELRRDIAKIMTVIREKGVKG